VPGITISATVVSDLLPELLVSLPVRATAIVGETAHVIRDNASAGAPRDTGSLAASVYVVTPTESDYGQRTADAMARDSKAEMLSEVERPEPGNAYIGVAASHGVFNEEGTVRMAARPFLRPAAEAERQPYQDRIAATIVLTRPGA